MSIEDVKRKYEGELKQIPEVVGVDIAKTAGGRVLRVYVTRDTEPIRKKIPPVLDGFLTEIVKVGAPRTP